MKLRTGKKLPVDDIPDLPGRLQKWEYKVVEIFEELEKRLDELGSAGWELVSIEKREEASRKYSWSVFKRPVY